MSEMEKKRNFTPLILILVGIVFLLVLFFFIFKLPQTMTKDSNNLTIEENINDTEETIVEKDMIIDTEPEENIIIGCVDNLDCATHEFCSSNDECLPLCIDGSGDVRTNFIGAGYESCWNLCAGSKYCCDRAFFFYDGGSYNGEQWFRYACRWYPENNFCSGFDVCLAPGGNYND